MRLAATLTYVYNIYKYVGYFDVIERCNNFYFAVFRHAYYHTGSSLVVKIHFIYVTRNAGAIYPTAVVLETFCRRLDPLAYL